jgi:hypothetical protein
VTLLFQIVGLSLLLAGLALGYGRWIKPHASVLDWQGKGLLLLVVLTLAGGFIGSPFWWMDEARSFSWDLPPLASRMLASAGWSFVVVCWLVLERPTDRRLRLVLFHPWPWPPPSFIWTVSIRPRPSPMASSPSSP